MTAVLGRGMDVRERIFDALAGPIPRFTKERFAGQLTRQQLLHLAQASTTRGVAEAASARPSASI